MYRRAPSSLSGVPAVASIAASGNALRAPLQSGVGWSVPHHKRQHLPLKQEALNVKQYLLHVK